jgi:Zn-dependent alcohol dehydrogenase
MKVRAAVLREMGLPAPYAESKPLTIETLELAPPGPGEMLVRVLAAGVCHSDLSVVNGSRPRVMPMALGHEGVGEVVELGSDVHGFSVGDRVTFAFVPVCGTCDACACGRPVLCESGAAANTAGTLLSGARRLTHPSGEEIHHHLGVSAFSEAIVVSERSAVKIDPDLDPTVAALFGCAAMTGVGAVVNTAGVKLGESVIILGLGGVGLAALLGALACGANPVVASDPVPEKPSPQAPTRWPTRGR